MKDDKRQVIRLGMTVGLSRLKAIEFWHASKRTRMKCVLCGEVDVPGRWFTLGPGGLHSVGTCRSCGSRPTFAVDVAAVLAERHMAEKVGGFGDGEFDSLEKTED